MSLSVENKVFMRSPSTWVHFAVLLSGLILKYLHFRVLLSEKRNRFNQVQGLTSELELPDFVNKNTRCPVKFEIQRRHDYFKRVSLSHAIFWTYLY